MLYNNFDQQVDCWNRGDDENEFDDDVCVNDEFDDEHYDNSMNKQLDQIGAVDGVDPLPAESDPPPMDPWADLAAENVPFGLRFKLKAAKGIELADGGLPRRGEGCG